MMNLPTFTISNPSVQWLRNEQERLVNQANKMMAETKILDIFKKHGHLSPIDGSYLYRLMIYPDLDIALTANNITKKDFASLLFDLASQPYVRSIETADTVNFNVSKLPRPKGYWIGLEIPFQDDRWGIDCWFQQPDWQVRQNDNNYTVRLMNLNETGRDAVLAIKYQLIKNGTYGKQYMSRDVYNAVLDNNVRSINDFEEFAQSKS